MGRLHRQRKSHGSVRHVPRVENAEGPGQRRLPVSCGCTDGLCSKRRRYASMTLLPVPPDRRPTDSAVSYGSTLLQYVLATDCVALMSAEQLELAHHASSYAVAAREMDPNALEAIQRIRPIMTAAIVRRRNELSAVQ